MAEGEGRITSVVVVTREEQNVVSDIAEMRSAFAAEMEEKVIVNRDV